MKDLNDFYFGMIYDENSNPTETTSYIEEDDVLEAGGTNVRDRLMNALNETMNKSGIIFLNFEKTAHAIAWVKDNDGSTSL